MVCWFPEIQKDTKRSVQRTEIKSVGLRKRELLGGQAKQRDPVGRTLGSEEASKGS